MSDSRSIGRAISRIAVAAIVLAPLEIQGAVDYTTEVKPLLKEHCYRCHGSSQQKGKLRADTAANLIHGGESGAGVVPGKTEESLVIQALRGTHDTISRMPYKKPPLSEAEITTIATWIQEGAKAPADEAPESIQHWAFVLPVRPAVPKPAKTSGSIGNPIDAFILARLEQEKLAPSPEADRATLLRRLSLDLIGLPPTPEEIEAFKNDSRSDAYERQVDRLLASPHYGERWGRWWLDAARYADSNGYSIDAPRQIWKYRDWVIDALNADMPYDQFAVEQLAGDLLPGATIDQKIATGFNRNTQVNQEGGIDPEQFRVECVMDRVNTFGTVFLGLTVGCAQCHDHKFDPISQREYYQLYAFFNNTLEDGHGKSAPDGMMAIPGEFEPMDGILKQLEESRGELERFLDTKGSQVKEWSESLEESGRAKLKPGVADYLDKPWSELDLEGKRALYAAFKPDDKEFKSRNGKVEKLEKHEPKPVTTLVMQELKHPRESHLFIKGDFTRPGDLVHPGTPASLHPFKVAGDHPANRLDLARWVFQPGNPVTARVTVNRVWQQYFGRGLVETENDFGTQGSLPTHPELLDWLACEFMKPGEGPAAPWSLKHLHRLIVNSATYKQSSRHREDLLHVDAANKLLARQSRLRLDAEIIRDTALAACGLLSPEFGGPPVYPPQPDGVMSLGQVKRAWKTSAGPERFRRGIYTHIWRATPHPALAVFDAPEGFSTCTRRLRSNTPLQSLTLLNDQQYYEFAQALAKRVLAEAPGDAASRMERAMKLCVGRAPSAVEQERLTRFLAQQSSRTSNETELWTALSRVLLNLDETITRE